MTQYSGPHLSCQNLIQIERVQQDKKSREEICAFRAISLFVCGKGRLVKFAFCLKESKSCKVFLSHFANIMHYPVEGWAATKHLWLCCNEGGGPAGWPLEVEEPFCRSSFLLVTKMP